MGQFNLKLIGFAIGVLLLSASGGFSADTDSIPTPKYDICIKTRDIIDKELRDRLDKKYISVTMTNDEEYVGITHKYFKEFNKWYMAFVGKQLFTSYEKNNGNPPKEAYDCENHARLYKSMMSFASLGAKSPNRELLVGIIMVEQKHKQLGIPVGGGHALNLVHTDRGWMVFDPQTGEFCKLSKYKNSIYSYIF